MPKASKKRKVRQDDKKRAPSQRLGTVGEKAFSYQASIQGLLATKYTDDVGIDFICQIDEDPTSADASNIAPEILGVCARTTKSESGGIRLARSDAGALLRAHFPACVVVVREIGSTHVISFRMLDADFRSRLLDFLESTKKTISFGPAVFTDLTQIRERLNRLIEGGYSEEQKLATAVQRLQDTIDKVAIEVRRGPRGATTLVTTVDMYSYFNTLAPPELQRLYLATFGAADRASDRVAQLAVKTRLVKELNGLPEPFMLVGFTQEKGVVLRVKGPNGEAECPFVWTTNGEFWGWCKPIGFALTASKARPRGKVWVHELRAFADADEIIHIDSHPELEAFLACCHPEANLGKVDDDPMPFKVRDYEDLSLFGWYVGYHRKARRLRGWTSSATDLRDATDPEAMNTMAWLAALSERPNEVSQLGFSLDSVDPDVAATFRVPVLCNTTSHSILVWLDCVGFVRRADDAGVVSGVRISKVTAVNLEVHERHLKTTTDLEFLFGDRLIVARGDSGFYLANGRRPEAFDKAELSEVRIAD